MRKRDIKRLNKPKHAKDFLNSVEDYAWYHIEKYDLAIDISTLNDPEIYNYFEDLLNKHRLEEYERRIKQGSININKIIEENPDHQSNAGKEGSKVTIQIHKENDYYNSEEFKKIQSKGGTTSGNNNVESGHLDNIRDMANAVCHSKITCIHCGEPGDYINIVRYHNDNCPYPLMKEYIESIIEYGTEFKIKPLIENISNATGTTPLNVRSILKKIYLVPSGKHNMWKWDPIKEGEGHRPVQGAMFKKLPFSTPNRDEVLAKMLYDLIDIDLEFTIKELSNIQSKCEYRLHIRHILTHSPKFFKVIINGRNLSFKKITG